LSLPPFARETKRQPFTGCSIHFNNFNLP